MSTEMTQVNCKTLGFREIRKYYATGSGAMDHIITHDGLCQLLEVQLKLSAASITSEDFTIMNDSGLGSAYDIDLLNDDLSADATIDLIFKPDEEALSDNSDVFKFTYTNTDNRTWGLTVYIEYL